MKSNYTHLSVLLDRSGSMESRRADTCGGFNEFIKTQRELPGACTLTLVQFDTEVDVVHDGIQLDQVPPLEFSPRGSTALLDAIGLAIDRTGNWLERMREEDRPERVIFIIMTDGYENASKRLTREKVFEMIQRQENVYKWQFVYLGANHDAIQEGQQLGIPRGSTITTDSLRPQQAYATLNKKLRDVRVGASATVAFDDQDREENKPGKPS